MIARILPIVVASAALAACSSEPSVSATNASVSDVMNQVEASGAKVTMRPGQWEATMSMSGMPGPQGANAAQKTQICVTEDQVKPGSNPFAQQLQAGCKYDRFNMADGKIDGEMTCQMMGQTVKSAVSGEFAPDAYTMTTTTEMSGPQAGPMAGQKIVTKVDARRIGDCAPGATTG